MVESGHRDSGPTAQLSKTVGPALVLVLALSACQATEAIQCIICCSGPTLNPGLIDQRILPVGSGTQLRGRKELCADCIRGAC